MQHAGSGLKKVVADAIRRAAPEQAPLLAWPLACGPAVAEHTRALNCADGVLRVEVPDAAWRTELLALAPQYVATLRQFGVKKVEFVIAQSSPGYSKAGPSLRSG